MSAASLSTARERIAAAYDPALLREAMHRLADLLNQHFTDRFAAQGPVLSWHEPADNVELAAQLASSGGTVSDDTSSRLERIEELLRATLERAQNLHHPRYVGHQVPASLPLAALFDFLGAATNQGMAIYEMGPWVSAAERAVIDTLLREIGWQPESAAGICTHGASLANLTALLTARNVKLDASWEQGVRWQQQVPAVVVQQDAHYSVSRAVGVLGLGTGNVIRVPVDSRRRMEPQALQSVLQTLEQERRPVIAVVAAACATPIGAFDPLDQIAEICAAHDVWLHVDAAHGGAALLSDRHRERVRGLERADSIVWDAHKMLFVPALCAFVFYRNREHRFAAFRQDAPYLFDPTAPGMAEYDSGTQTLECTKRAAAMGLWGAWSLFGRQLFVDLVDVTFELGQEFYNLLQEADDFVALHEPECNIVAFRHIPPELREAPPERVGKFQLALRRAVITSGDAYLVPIQLDGVGALRATLINPLTTRQDLVQILEIIRKHARELHSSCR